MTTNKLFATVCCVIFAQVTLNACAATSAQEDSKSAPVYFGDCAVVNLEGTDGRNLTREELIAAEESALLDALDENSECNQKALSAGQQAVTAAGATSGNGGGSGEQSGANGQGQASSTGGQNSSNQNATNQTNQTPEQVVSPTSGVGGGKTGVQGQEITVCQISQENLAASNTPEDKAFWQNEVAKNCN